jgi:predicted DNA-binding protein
MLIRIPPELAEELRALARRTRVPLAVYQREAVADLVTKYRNRKES